MEQIDVINDIIVEGELPSFAEDGTDLTLIRWMLSLTPVQRLQVLQDHVTMIESMREANANHTISPNTDDPE